MGVPDNYKIFFFQGGASLQFTAIPLNLLREKTKANYFTTGAWSQAAIAEAKKYCTVNEVWPDSKNQFNTLPDPSTWNIDQEAAYFHYCDNETIHGVEFSTDFPFEKVPADQVLVCDMSSNMCSRKVQWEKYGVVYAGAQKNIGPSGACVVVIREDLIGHQRKDTPCLCDWKTFNAAPNTYHNTPACYPIYVCGLNLAHMKEKGLQHYIDLAEQRSKMLYDTFEGSNGYYTNPVEPKYRSRMNIPFRVKSDEALEAKFLKEAESAGLIELKGHRSVGGCRASLYNAMTLEGVEALISFMKKFQEANP